jgi:probable F420-dependent oxidoreductase
MDFGVNTMTRGPMANRAGYLAVAERAERLGFGYLTVNDHIVVPRDIGSRYPYTEAGEWPGKAFGECFDQLATIAFLAGCTKRLRLLTSVMVLPHRHPVLAAKMLATADVLSEGRVIVGAGVGWMREEFEAVGAPPFADRGRVADEYLAAMKELWTSDEPSFEGAYARFKNVVFAPKPVQKPHPPIWIGGESAVALRRTARFGDGWYPASNNPQRRLDTPARLAEALDELRRACEAAGRDPTGVDIAYLVLWPVDWTAGTGTDGKRRIFTGSSADIAADAAAFAGLGVRHLSLTFQATELKPTLERMQRFAEEVAPLVDKS